jgi:polyisoprenoid-binding protein YceI
MSAIATQTTPTTRWSVDGSRSAAVFRVPTYWGLHTVEGRFSAIDGSFEQGPDGSRIELTLDAASLDTGNRVRDRHLRDEAFFDVESHPEVRFASTSVVDRGDGSLIVSGQLEAAGRKLPLTLRAHVVRHGNELEIETTKTIDQHELGMTRSPLGMIRRPATVHVVARLRPA